MPLPQCCLCANRVELSKSRPVPQQLKILQPEEQAEVFAEAFGDGAELLCPSSERICNSCWCMVRKAIQKRPNPHSSPEDHKAFAQRPRQADEAQQQPAFTQPGPPAAAHVEPAAPEPTILSRCIRVGHTFA